MFAFTIRYFGFLKAVPGLAIVFDAWLMICTWLTNPGLLDDIDRIALTTRRWPGITITTHKYGGRQINYLGKELGHIHSNGLLDMPLSRAGKQKLMEEGRVIDHHTFIGTGWISFYIRDKADADYALTVLQAAYNRRSPVPLPACSFA